VVKLLRELTKRLSQSIRAGTNFLEENEELFRSADEKLESSIQVLGQTFSQLHLLEKQLDDLYKEVGEDDRQAVTCPPGCRGQGRNLTSGPTSCTPTLP